MEKSFKISKQELLKALETSGDGDFITLKIKLFGLEDSYKGRSFIGGHVMRAYSELPNGDVYRGPIRSNRNPKIYVGNIPGGTVVRGPVRKKTNQNDFKIELNIEGANIDIND